MMNKLDINSAEAEAFDAHEELRGHGPEIVRYRDERRGFTSLRQLDEVPGLSGKVGPETMAKLSVGGS